MANNHKPSLSSTEAEFHARENDSNTESGPEGETDPFTYKDGTNILGKAEKHDYAIDLEKNYVKYPADVIHIEVHKNRHLRINKNLIPLRIAIIFCYGAGRLPSTFLSVFLKQRGISLIEFSSMFSLVFLSQIIWASICGIIADKIGNSKPLLLLNMLAALTVVICLLRLPSINNETCEKQEINFTCLDMTDHDSYNCTYTCFDKDNVYQLGEDFNTSVRNIKPRWRTANESQEKFNTSRNLCGIFLGNCTISCLKTNCELTKSPHVISYTFLTVAFLTFSSTKYRFMDLIIMSLIREHSSSYGYEHVFGMVSETITAFIVAFAMDASDSNINSRNKYDLVFWMYAGFLSMAIISVCSIKAKINDTPTGSLSKKAIVLMKNIEIIAFLVLMSIIGTACNFNTNFSFLFLEYLNAPKSLFGLHNACASITGFPTFLTATWWLRKVGTKNIFLIELLTYAIHGYGYSLLYDPLLTLVFEAFRSSVGHIFWVAAVQHSQDVAPEGLVATVTAVSCTLHCAIGRSVGVFGGGILVHAVGLRSSYSVIATTCLTTAFVYGIFTTLRKRKLSSTAKKPGKLK